MFLVSGVVFTQNNHIVKTDDGRRVLLKADYTWEYIDVEKPAVDGATSENISKTSKSCGVAQDFVEPKLNNKIQSQLKKGRATISHVKKKVAKDYNCEVSDVLLLSFSEQKEKGMYHFCANGTKVTYKRIGSTIIKHSKLF